MKLKLLLSLIVLIPYLNIAQNELLAQKTHPLEDFECGVGLIDQAFQRSNNEITNLALVDFEHVVAESKDVILKLRVESQIKYDSIRVRTYWDTIGMMYDNGLLNDEVVSDNIYSMDKGCNFYFSTTNNDSRVIVDGFLVGYAAQELLLDFYTDNDNTISINIKFTAISIDNPALLNEIKEIEVAQVDKQKKATPFVINITQEEKRANFLLGGASQYGGGNFSLPNQPLVGMPNISVNCPLENFSVLPSNTPAGSAGRLQLQGNIENRYFQYISFYGNFNSSVMLHEMIHGKVNIMGDAGSPNINTNNGHWFFVEQETSGFGSQVCYNGWNQNIRLENGAIVVDPKRSLNLGRDNKMFLSKLEMALFGIMPMDSISFPLKIAIDTKDKSACAFESGDQIYYMEREEFDQYYNTNPVSFSDYENFNLRFLIGSDSPVSDLALQFFSYLVRGFPATWDRATGNRMPNFLQVQSGFFKVDDDGDGFSGSEDCDDANPAINIQAEEIPNNGIDEDCNGEDLVITSIYEIGKNQINIFPNPVSSTFNINITNYDNSLFEVRMYNLNGQTIFSDRQVRNSISIDLSEQPSSIYLLEIMDTKTGKRVVEKIEKIR